MKGFEARDAIRENETEIHFVLSSHVAWRDRTREGYCGWRLRAWNGFPSPQHTCACIERCRPKRQRNADRPA
jgi:hypothetical protein